MPDWLNLQAHELGWLSAGVGFVLLLVWALVSWGKKLWHRLKIRRRMKWAAKAEDVAAKVLRKAGYKIIGSQVEHEHVVYVSGIPVPCTIRADYMVSRQRRTYIAEVKTGKSAPKIHNSGTRRQLLEYLVAYPVDGVLLVDMERRVIQQVHFPGSTPPSPIWPMVLWFLTGAGVGVGLALWWASTQ